MLSQNRIYFISEKLIDESFKPEDLKTVCNETFPKTFSNYLNLIFLL